MYINPKSAISKALRIAGAVLALWLFFRIGLPWTAPILLAFAAAMVLEKPVRALCRRRIPRPAAAGLCVGGFLGLLAAVLWLVLSRAITELQHLGTRLPELAAAVSSLLGRWQSVLGGFATRLPPSLTQVLDSAAAGVTDYLYSLPGKISSRAVELLTGFIGNLPTWLLFAVTWLMGLYFISAAYPRVVEHLRRQVPPRIYSRALRVKEALGQSLGKYLKAQLIMSAITFGVILIAFTLLNIDSALVLALGVAVIDALPVFGAGTVLVPWAAWELLAGDPSRGLGLAISYGAATILRSCIQAKLLGDQLGLHPIATLLAIYAGWRALGVWGMILFPIAAISLKKLNDSGVIHLWKGSDTNDRNNIQHNSGNGHEHTGGHEYPSG